MKKHVVSEPAAETLIQTETKNTQQIFQGPHDPHQPNIQAQHFKKEESSQ